MKLVTIYANISIAEDVLDAFQKYGFAVSARHTKNCWVCFTCERK